MSKNFNLLECFDENIDNLIIGKNYIYVLKLIDDRYYVGRTGNILRRVNQHFKGYGAKYTKTYKPLKVIEVTDELTKEDERKVTFKYVEKYGWDKVRGSYWCSVNMKRAIRPRDYEYIKDELEKETEEYKNKMSSKQLCCILDNE